MKSIITVLFILSCSSISLAQYRFAKVENGQLVLDRNSHESIIPGSSSDSIFLKYSYSKEKKNNNYGGYSNTTNTKYYVVENLNNSSAGFPKRISDYTSPTSYLGAERLLNNFDIPFLSDGLYVDNYNEEVFYSDGKSWMTFKDLEELLTQSGIASHKKLKKLNESNKRCWVSNFYKGKAFVAVFEYRNLRYYADLFLVGTLSKEKEFTAYEKPIDFDLVPHGIYPSGYLVFGKGDKRKVYDSNLKSVSSKTFIPWIDAKERVESKTKGYTSFYRSSEVTQQINKEGYVLVGKSSKKLSKNKQSLINYSDLEGNLLFKTWMVTDRAAKREFRNGNVVLLKETEWVEINSKGETTFYFPKDVIRASYFVNDKALIQTEKGLALIDRSGKVLTPHLKELYIKPDNGFLLNNGYGIVSRIEDERDVVVDETLRIVVENERDARFTYYNDSLLLAYFTEEEKKYVPKDYSKELPEVNQHISKVGNFDIYLSSGFIPDKEGYISPNTKEKFFVSNHETFEHEVQIIFFYETKTGGSVQRITKHWKTFTVTIPPNEVRIIDPSSISDIKLRTYDDQYKQRNFKFGYKVDGKTVIN